MPMWTSKAAILTLGGPTRTAVLVGPIPLRIERRSSAIQMLSLANTHPGDLIMSVPTLPCHTIHCHDLSRIPLTVSMPDL